MTGDRFDHVHVGDEADLTHTTTEADVETFVRLIGDTNPVHLMSSPRSRPA